MPGNTVDLVDPWTGALRNPSQDVFFLKRCPQESSRQLAPLTLVHTDHRARATQQHWGKQDLRFHIPKQLQGCCAPVCEPFFSSRVLHIFQNCFCLTGPFSVFLWMPRNALFKLRNKITSLSITNYFFSLHLICRLLGSIRAQSFQGLLPPCYETWIANTFPQPQKVLNLQKRKE